MFNNPDFECSSDGAPTEFSDVAFNAVIPINHPAEPVLVFYSDGSFEWAFEGDVDYMIDSNLGGPREVVNSVTVDAVLGELHTFIQRNPVNG